MTEQAPPQATDMAGATKPKNPLGVAGFVLSLVGFASCGFLSPVALILSGLGMRREPKGLATAGLVLGILGTLFLVLWGIWMAGSVFVTGQRTQQIFDQVSTQMEMQQRMERQMRKQMKEMEQGAGGPTTGPTSMLHWGPSRLLACRPLTLDLNQC